MEPPRLAGRKSAWTTLLIFCGVAFFNPEVLTGSTPVERFVNPLTILGVLFYGLQVAVIGDLAARFRLGWRAVYLMGLIYGIFEEGFAVMTMESPSPPGFAGFLRIWGLNTTWAIYIANFHAVISVASTLVLVRLVWPGRTMEPFLGRSQYATILPSTAAIYALFVTYVTRSFTPNPTAFVLLGCACFALFFLLRRSALAPRDVTGTVVSTRRLVLLAGLLVVGSGVAQWVFGVLPGGEYVVTVLGVAFALAFYLFFRALDIPGQFDGRRQLLVFSVFVGCWLLFGTFFRTPLSSVVAYGGVALEVYLGYRSLGGHHTNQGGLVY